MKKIIGCLLALIMLLGCFNFIVSAEDSDGFVYELLDENDLYYDGTYYSEKNTLEISGNIDYDILVSNSKNII